MKPPLRIESAEQAFNCALPAPLPPCSSQILDHRPPGRLATRRAKGLAFLACSRPINVSRFCTGQRAPFAWRSGRKGSSDGFEFESTDGGGRVTAIAYPSIEHESPSRTAWSRSVIREDASIVFVVPAYNEADNLPRLLADLERRPELTRGDSRVIVVDDGSTDGTAELAETYSGRLTVDVVRLGANQGPGAAFRAGFGAALAHTDDDALIVTIEADTTSDLDTLPAMLHRARHEADLVLASVHGGGRMINVGLLRRTLSRGAGSVVRFALGIDARTVSSFFRVYRASLLRAAHANFGEGLIREPGFACKAELLAKLSNLGARVSEVPVDLDASRRVGESKMRIGDTLAGYWRLVVRQRFARDTASA